MEKLALADLVFLIWMVLKLTGHIDWSWWWVTAPLWGSIILKAVYKIAMKRRMAAMIDRMLKQRN
jgi:hypothetical protein